MNIYELKKNSIEELIEAKEVGNYWLYRTNEIGESVIRYVGRSDKCLLKRLNQHAGLEIYEEFSFVISKRFPKVRNAYDIECREYHLLKDQLDNKIHPDAPRHLPYTCKFCKLEKQLSESNASEGVGVQ